MKIDRFEQNTEGTDYVVGDIHGCFDQLQSLIESVDFDPARDRLFSVGDLIDRGPRSPDALAWMNKPWFHACRGNHEHMLLSSDNSGSFMTWMLNGAGWWVEQDETTREQFRLAISQLPLAMEIALADAQVGIVHADIPEHLSWQEFTQAVEADDAAAIQVAVWGRDRPEGRVTTGVKGIDCVVCGHTIMFDRQPHRVGNAWFIDTGVYVGEPDGKLSLFSINQLLHDININAG